jgi:hypothetical protein
MRDQSAGRSPDVHLGDTFRLVGWAGFWIQVFLGVLPIVIGLWMFSASQVASSFARSISWASTLASASAIILVFTVLWFVRYIALGRRMKRTGSGVPQGQLRRTIGVGLVASAVGILLSAIVLLIETAQIVLAFLQAPQGGVPVVQTTAESSYWISAVDAISLFGVTLTISAEIIALVLSLYLRLRVSTTRVDATVPAARVAAV